VKSTVPRQTANPRAPAVMAPMAQAQRALAYLDRAKRAAAVDQAMLHWAERDLPAALAWAEGLSEPELRRDCLASLCTVWCGKDPPTAMKFIQSHDLGSCRTPLLLSALTGWMRLSPSQALAWADSLPPDGFKQEALATAAYALAATDIPGAATIAIEDLAAAPALQQAALIDIVHSWTGQDPLAAAQWVSEFPPGALREAVLRELILTWRQRDVSAATAWLKLHAEEVGGLQILQDSPSMISSVQL
jgi:hypothetical protein